MVERPVAVRARRVSGWSHAARRRRRPRILRRGLRRCRCPLHRRGTRSKRNACRRAGFARVKRTHSSARRAWRCRSPTTRVDICLSSNVAEHVPRPWQLGGEMLRVTKPGGLAVLSYTVWLGPFGGHEMGLTHYLGGAARRGALHPQTRSSGQKQLRIVVVRGIGGRRPELGGEHRRLGRRIPALPPSMGVVADVGAGATGVPGEQSRAGPSAAIMKHVLVLLRLG